MKSNRFALFPDSNAFILSAVTLGGALEWFEIGMFVSWQLIVQENETSFDLSIAESLNASAILVLILIALTFGGARALGGWFFGNKGDLQGRKKAFSLTILMSTFPSWGLFVLSFVLPYKQWIAYSTLIFSIAKFFQGMPAGGEIPGAICYLAETAVVDPKISKPNQLTELLYKCSYALLGPQIGLAISALICLILKYFFTTDTLLGPGWRYVFFATAMAGLGGYFIRHALKETHAFSNREAYHKAHHKIAWSPIKTVFHSYNKQLLSGFFLSIFEVASFSVLSILPLYYSKEPFYLSGKEVIFLSLSSSLLCIIFLPFIGYFSGKYFRFPWLQVSAWGIIFLSPFLYYTFVFGYFLSSICLTVLLLFLFSIQAAILPSMLASLFPVDVRYTGVAFSFNICDGILWAIVVSLSFGLISDNSMSFIFFLPIAAVIFLTALWWVSKKEEPIRKLFR